MSRNSPAAPSGGSRDAVHPLPNHPSLEYERKQAKALLRRLRAGDAEAHRRVAAQHAAFRQPVAPPAPTLADAQLVIAREYGFTSWPRLVRYFDTLEREAGANRSIGLWKQERYDQRVQELLDDHAKNLPYAGRAFACYIPHLYGQTIVEVLASPVTVDDARLVVARQHYSSNWQELVDYAAAQRALHDPWTSPSLPRSRAMAAIYAHDLSQLQHILGDHPELFEPSEEERRTGRTLLSTAVAAEPRDGRTDAHAITDWLASQGLDFHAALNRAIFDMFATVVRIAELIARGADPRTASLYGVSILEYALVQLHRNPEVAEFLSRQVTPPHSLWIAAGLGDVSGVRSFFKRDGSLVPQAYRHRPPLELLFPRNHPTLPEPDDLELLSEAALIATLNDRGNTLRVLIEQGCPVDRLNWMDKPLVAIAVERQSPSAVEVLVELGADLDLRGSGNYSARQVAGFRHTNGPTRNAESRRIVELCGAGDPDQLIAVAEAESAAEAAAQSPPQPVKHILDALELAGDDAARCRQPEVRMENLLVGALRSGEEIWPRRLAAAGADLLRLRQLFPDRLLPATDKLTREKIPIEATARAAIERMVALATELKASAVRAPHLMRALIEDDAGPAARLLVSVGTDLGRLRAEMTKRP